MLIYCIVCYLIMLGILLDQFEDLDNIPFKDIVIACFAPFIVPVVLGMSINGRKDG